MSNYTDTSFYEIQALKSFCKVKNTYMKYGKFHVSFVQHSGKDAGAKRERTIEGAIKFNGPDGALYLAQLILKGGLKTLAEAAKEKRAKEGKKYYDDIFKSIGGTSVSRSSTGKAVFRQFSIAPGVKSDYVLAMFQCDGVMSSTGGIQPEKGTPNSEKIIVPVSAGDLASMATAMLAEYEAYRVSVLVGSTKQQPQEQPEMRENPQTVSTTDTIPAQPISTPAPEKLNVVSIIYDTAGKFNQGIPVAVTLEKTENKVKEIIVNFLNAHKLVASPKTFTAFQDALKTDFKAGNSVTTTISFTSKINEDERDYLNVIIGVAE